MPESAQPQGHADPPALAAAYRDKVRELMRGKLLFDAAVDVADFIAAEVDRAYAQGRQDFAEYLSRLADNLYAKVEGRK